VVISIIALLVSILLPALGAARGAAILSSCLSNQRQLGVQHYVYATDNNDYFAPMLGYDETGTYTPPLGQFVNNGYTAGLAVSLNATNFKYNQMFLLSGERGAPLEAQSIAYCPGEDKNWYVAYNNPGTYREPTYYINGYISGVNGANQTEHNAMAERERVFTTKAGHVVNASGKALMLETHHAGAWGASWAWHNVIPGLSIWSMKVMYNEEFAAWAPSGAVSQPRHQAGFTTVFADGHAEFIRREGGHDDADEWHNYFYGAAPTAAQLAIRDSLFRPLAP